LGGSPRPHFPGTLFTNLSSLHLSKTGGGSRVKSSLPSPPLLYTHPPFGEGGCKAGTNSLLEIIKIYASVCKHTFKSWRFPSMLVYLNSRASWISSLSVVCLCHRQAANGRASRRCALCISLLPPPHTEGSVRPRNANHPAAPPPFPAAGSALAAGDCTAANALETQGYGAGGGGRGRNQWTGRWNEAGKMCHRLSGLEFPALRQPGALLLAATFPRQSPRATHLCARPLGEPLRCLETAECGVPICWFVSPFLRWARGWRSLVSPSSARVVSEMGLAWWVPAGAPRKWRREAVYKMAGAGGGHAET
jgi:hypothetical protein